MRRRCVVTGSLALFLIGSGGLEAQDAREGQIEFWSELLRGSRAAQTCLEDVVYEGATEVPCEEMHPAFRRAAEAAAVLEECCPEDATFFDEESGRRVAMANFARAHGVLADSVEAFRDRRGDEARSRKVTWAGQLMAWRGVVERFLGQLEPPSG